ncbi:MAG: hypothetical protein P8Y02_03400 [Deinococcales bacterium]|jgi:hypothetical protein
MTAEPAAATGPTGEARYEVRIHGHLEDRRAASFEGFTVERETDGSTRLVGEGIDQAALHGILRQIRDLGLPLISVARLGSASAEGADGQAVASGEEEVGS